MKFKKGDVVEFIGSKVWSVYPPNLSIGEKYIVLDVFDDTDDIFVLNDLGNMVLIWNEMVRHIK